MSDNDHRISKAPAPIPAIRLSGARGGLSKPRYQAPIAPDWSFWPPSRPVAQWQAVALSLNLDPDSLKHSPHGWMAGPGAPPSFLAESFPDAETKTAFNKRSDLQVSYRPAHRELLPLQDFATWAASVNLAPIPPELAAMASEKTTSGGQGTETPPASEQAKSEAQEGSAGTWMEQARKIADEFFARDTANKCRDSLAGYSSRVMDAMQEQNIHGPRGRITNPKTIQRDALQGKMWWATKKP